MAVGQCLGPIFRTMYFKVFLLNSRLAGLFLPNHVPEEAKSDSPDRNKAESVGTDRRK